MKPRSRERVMVGSEDKTALVLIHLSSLDSYTDLEYEATRERDGGYDLALRMAEAVLEHDGPVVIVDQGWLFVGRESRPRERFMDEVGMDQEQYEKFQQTDTEKVHIYEQREPRPITWMKFDEQFTKPTWNDFLKTLEKHLKKLGVKKVVLGGLYFERDLSEGCVTHTFKYLRERFQTEVAIDHLTGSISHFYGRGEDLPGGYTHGR